MRVYIVWVKSKKVTFKILQAECFVGTSRDDLSQSTSKMKHLTLQLPTCAFYVLFSREPFSRTSCKLVAKLN